MFYISHLSNSCKFIYVSQVHTHIYKDNSTPLHSTVINGHTSCFTKSSEFVYLCDEFAVARRVVNFSSLTNTRDNQR